MGINEFVKRFDNVRPAGDGFSARCPCHDDNNNSLSIKCGDNGGIVVFCHVCGKKATPAVVLAVGCAMSDLMPNDNGSTKRRSKGRIVETYDYCDANGKLVYQAVRKEPKAFLQRRPDDKGGWFWNMKGVERVLYRLPELRAADPSKCVFIVEGEKDCDRLRGLGLVATCNVGGAGKWLKKYNNELRGLHVVIIADHDVPGHEHAKQIADSLNGTAASVKILFLFDGPLPEKHGKDVSDWLNNGGSVEQLKALVMAAGEWQPTEENDGNGDDIDEAFTGLIKEIADRICAADHFAQDEGGKMYRYNGGAYRSKGEQFIRQRVKALCGVLNQFPKWTPRLAENVIEFIRVDAPTLWERPPLDVLNVKNGLLRLSDRALLPHSHEHLTTVQLPVTFDPNATCPAIDKFVSEVFPPDATALAYEIPSTLVLPDTALQMAILLLGAGGNGKSVFLTLLVNFLGSNNVSALSLHKLESDRFAAARLIGKLANICADLPTEHLSGTSIFKSITGGDPITAEYKFRDSFDFTPFARLVFSANSPPRSQDSSEGFFERWHVIPFDGKFRGTGQEIPKPELDARLSTAGELSGMLNRALDAREVIVKRCGKLHSCESVEAAHREFHATTDPLGVWLDGFTIDDPQACVPKRVLRAAYGAACEQAGRPLPTEKQFTLALRKHRSEISEGQRTLNGRREHCFIGIGLRTTDAHLAQDAQGTPYLFSPTNRVREESDNERKEPAECRTSKGQAVQVVQPVQQCDRCGSGEYKDVPIHNGCSIRRDCAKCGRTLGFPTWKAKA